jgi:hypothetical protein
MTCCRRLSRSIHSDEKRLEVILSVVGFVTEPALRNRGEAEARWWVKGVTRRVAE